MLAVVGIVTMQVGRTKKGAGISWAIDKYDRRVSWFDYLAGE